MTLIGVVWKQLDEKVFDALQEFEKLFHWFVLVPTTERINNSNGKKKYVNIW